MGSIRYSNGTDFDTKFSESKRGAEFVKFAYHTLKHVEGYTVPQYGDKGDDNATGYTGNDYVVQIRKYANRLESGQRGDEEKERDLFKLAHYAAMLWAHRRGE